MLAGSGGGTRAALYTAAVLHGLARFDKLDRVVLASGVSGGSAALAYFATNRKTLLENKDESWKQMRNTLSSPFIEDVLAGAAEWRIVSNHRWGKLLEESFERRFKKWGNHDEIESRSNLGAISDIGLIFNTAICGISSKDRSSRKIESALEAGGRLVITNLHSSFDIKPDKDKNEWDLDIPFEVVQDPEASIFKAAALSANFPPVFSNAAVDLGDRRFWVTDGGAMENRGLLSLLLALVETLKIIRGNAIEPQKRPELSDIHIIVANAGAFDPEYKSDRRVGAKFGAPEQIANRLIKELIEKVQILHKAISGREKGIRIIRLPMPPSLRASGTFGTHWMMPATVVLDDPFSEDEDRPKVEVTGDQAKEIIDAMFSKQYSEEYIQRRWPELDAKSIIAQTKLPWNKLAAGLK
jgi:hypothetical protein